MRWKRGCIALALLCCYYTALRPALSAVATPGPLILRPAYPAGVAPPPRQPQREDAPATRIAVCAASKSKPTWRSLNDTALATLLIPSLEWSTRGEPYTFILYLAFDHDDAFWREHAAGLAYPAHAIKYDFYTTPTHKIPFNELTNHAYTDGADYIVRINDDTEFVTGGWATLGVEALAAFTPANVGVVGPTFKEGNTAILTHDMVHRTHIDIFKYYYPPVFSAWWIDDWITKVYEPGRMRKLSTWHVAHHVSKHGTRYTVQHHESKHLKAEIERGRKVLREWVDKLPPAAQWLTMVGRCPHQDTAPSRLDELHMTIKHNLMHYTHPRMVLLCTTQEMQVHQTWLHHYGVSLVPRPNPSTYEDLFRLASTLPGVKMVVNGDISLENGIDLLQAHVDDNTIVALSRHAAKDRCFVSHGTNPGANQCKTYVGSHDAFVFRRKLDTNAISKLAGIFPHYWGAENVAIHELSKIPGVRFTNPCNQVRIYHQHCVPYFSASKKAAPRVNRGGRSGVVPPTDIVKVAVVIPTCNRQRTLTDAIESVVQQTVKVDSIYVTTKCSMPIRIRQKWSDIVKVIKVPNSSGRAGAERNAGLDAISRETTHVAFLDDDDVWLPTKLERQLREMQKHGVGLISSDALYSETPRCRKNGVYISWDTAPGGRGGMKLWNGGKWKSRLGVIPTRVTPSVLDWHNILVTSATLVTTKVLGTERFDEREGRGQDYTFWKKLIQKTDAIYLNDGLVIYNNHDLSACQQPRNVISFSLYGKDPRYLEGAPANVELAKTLYPGWFVRFYHDNTVPRATLERLRSPRVELINMAGQAGNPMEWRFLVAEDETVGRYIIRDVDSRLNEREHAAVLEWIASGMAFHTMRDHPGHCGFPINGGMWGGTRILRVRRNAPGAKFWDDMEFLKEKVWPTIANLTLQHASFCCNDYGTSRAFPTRRKGLEHVGSVFIGGKPRASDESKLASAGVRAAWPNCSKFGKA